MKTYVGVSLYLAVYEISTRDTVQQERVIKQLIYRHVKWRHVDVTFM
jgi:hypothetical protein